MEYSLTDFGASTKMKDSKWKKGRKGGEKELQSNIFILRKCLNKIIANRVQQYRKISYHYEVGFIPRMQG